MELLRQILVILVLVFVATWISGQIKKHILSQYKIKKIYVLIPSILFFIAYFSLAVALQNNPKIAAIVQYAILTIICVFMTTYFEIVRMEREEKNKPVVGRPMAKPRRANKGSK